MQHLSYMYFQITESQEVAVCEFTCARLPCLLWKEHVEQVVSHMQVLWSLPPHHTSLLLAFRPCFVGLTSSSSNSNIRTVYDYSIDTENEMHWKYAPSESRDAGHFFPIQVTVSLSPQLTILWFKSIIVGLCCALLVSLAAPETPAYDYGIDTEW